MLKQYYFYQNNVTFVSVNYSEGCRNFAAKTGVRLVEVPFLYGSNVSAGLCLLLKIPLFQFAFKCLKSIHIASNAYTLPRQLSSCGS